MNPMIKGRSGKIPNGCKNAQPNKIVTSIQKHFFSLSGGVQNCGAEIPKRYAYTEGTNNTIEITLCGHPQPKLQYTFKGKTEKAEMIEKVDDSKKMYKYKINLNNIDRKDNGSTIVFKATGFRDWQAKSAILFECKNYSYIIWK